MSSVKSEPSIHGLDRDNRFELTTWLGRARALATLRDKMDGRAYCGARITLLRQGEALLHMVLAHRYLTISDLRAVRDLWCELADLVESRPGGAEAAAVERRIALLSLACCGGFGESAERGVPS